MPPRTSRSRVAVPQPKCIVCYNGDQQQCIRGSVSGVCLLCYETKPPQGCSDLDFLTKGLIDTIIRDPNRPQVPICPKSNCWHEANIWVREWSSSPLTLRLPATPLSTLPRETLESMDAAIAHAVFPQFRAQRSPAFSALRYLSLLCPASITCDNSPDSMTGSKIFLLGSVLLAGFSHYLVETEEIVVKFAASEDCEAHQRDTALSELAVLYTGILKIHKALIDVRVWPLIGDEFRIVFIDRLYGLLQGLHHYNADACAHRRVWWNHIGLEFVDKIREGDDLCSNRLHLFFEPSCHEQQQRQQQQQQQQQQAMYANGTNSSSSRESNDAAMPSDHSMDEDVDATWIRPTVESPQYSLDLMHASGGSNGAVTSPIPARDMAGEPLVDDVLLPSIAEITSSAPALFFPPNGNAITNDNDAVAAAYAHGFGFDADAANSVTNPYGGSFNSVYDGDVRGAEKPEAPTAPADVFTDTGARATGSNTASTSYTLHHHRRRPNDIERQAYVAHCLRRDYRPVQYSEAVDVYEGLEASYGPVPYPQSCPTDQPSCAGYGDCDGHDDHDHMMAIASSSLNSAQDIRRGY